MKALSNAILTRGSLKNGIIHHSDRGSTYASHQYKGLLRRHGIKSSMSATGNCYDNAAMESFFGRYKTSCKLKKRIFSDELDVRKHVFDYIEIKFWILQQI